MTFSLTLTKDRPKKKRSRQSRRPIHSVARCLLLVSTSPDSSNSLHFCSSARKTHNLRSSKYTSTQEYDRVFSIALTITRGSFVSRGQTILRSGSGSWGDLQSVSKQISQTQKNERGAHQVLHAEGLQVCLLTWEKGGKWERFGGINAPLLCRLRRCLIF